MIWEPRDVFLRSHLEVCERVLGCVYQRILKQGNLHVIRITIMNTHTYMYLIPDQVYRKTFYVLS